MGETISFLNLSGGLELIVLGVIIFYAASRIARTDWGGETANMWREWMVAIFLVFGVVFWIGAATHIIGHDPDDQQPRIQKQNIEKVPTQP